MPCLAAEFHEMTQVALTGPIELPFDLFMMNPEDVGGDNVHACSLHLEDLILPVLRGVSREMELPHDWEHWLAIQGEKTAVHLEVVPG